MNTAATSAGCGRLHILLPVHNRRETTVRFVESLGRQTRRDFRLILIDDGSRDGTAGAVQTLWPTVEVVRGDGNWWWAGCLDQGCRHLQQTGVTDDDILLLVNDDVVVGPEFLAQGLDEFEGMRDTLLLARQVDAGTGDEIDHGGGVIANLRQLRFAAAGSPDQINCLPTRGLFLRWRDLVRVGGFRPQSLPHYLSDYEFTIRAGKRGLHLKVACTVSLGVRMDQSGRSLTNLFAEPRGRRFALLFSNRFKDNPVTWSVFVWLAAAPLWRPYLWTKIWLHFLTVVTRCLIVPIKSAPLP
jgi:GT2 family glycosyltransferase